MGNLLAASTGDDEAKRRDWKGQSHHAQEVVCTVLDLVSLHPPRASPCGAVINGPQRRQLRHALPAAVATARSDDFRVSAVEAPDPIGPVVRVEDSSSGRSDQWELTSASGFDTYVHGLGEERGSMNLRVTETLASSASRNLGHGRADPVLRAYEKWSNAKAKPGVMDSCRGQPVRLAVPRTVDSLHRDLRGQTQADHVRPEHRRGRVRGGREYNKIDCVASTRA